MSVALYYPWNVQQAEKRNNFYKDKHLEPNELNYYLNISRGGEGDLGFMEMTCDDLDEVKKQLKRSNRLTGERLQQRIGI